MSASLGNYQFKLTYFDGKGAAETTRYLFALRQKPYDDIRLSFDEFRAKQALGDIGPENLHRLPLLDVIEADGSTFRIGQSAAIERIVATCLLLRGSNIRETAIIDNFCEHLVEMNTKYRMHVPFQQISSGEKHQAMETWFTTPVPSPTEVTSRYLLYYLDKLESLVRNEGTVIHGKVTLADAKLYSLFVDIGFDNTAAMKEALKDYPKLARIVENFAAQPEIKTYLAHRKPTIF